MPVEVLETNEIVSEILGLVLAAKRQQHVALGVSPRKWAKNRRKPRSGDSISQNHGQSCRKFDQAIRVTSSPLVRLTTKVVDALVPLIAITYNLERSPDTS